MRKLLVLCAAALAAAAPAYSVTIQPGIYNMEWTVPGKQAEMLLPSQEPMRLNIAASGEMDKCPGLVSKKCMVGSNDLLRVILDESRGTDTGYDTAYVFLASALPKDGSVDLSTAAKVRLKKGEGVNLEPPAAELATLELPLGGKDSKIKQKFAIDVRVGPGPFEESLGADKELYCYATVRGNWTGKLRTDSGELTIQLLDLNSNQVYNDKVKFDSSGAPEPGDVILVGEIPTSVEPDLAKVMFLGEVTAYDGKLYRAVGSPAGDTIDVKPYGGPKGRLRIKAVDGHGRPARCTLAIIVCSGKGVFFASSGGTEGIELPAGTCKLEGAGIEPGNKGETKPPISIMAGTGRSITIAANKTTNLTLGGPMTMTTQPPGSTFTRKRGEELQLNIQFTAGGQSVGVQSGPNAKIVITDAKGKQVLSGQSSFG